MLTRVRIAGFKRLRSVEMQLGRLNVLVGRNGAGKSSVLQALHLASRMGAPAPGEIEFKTGRPGLVFRGPQHEVRALLAGGASQFEIEAWRDHDPHAFGIVARAADPADPLAPREAFTLGFGGETLDLPSDPWKNPVPMYRALEAGRIGSAVHLKLRPEAIFEPCASEREVPRVEWTGAGVAAVLQHHAGLRDGVIERIEADVSRVVPEVQRLRVHPAMVPGKRRVKVSVNGQDTWIEERIELNGSRFEAMVDGVGWLPADRLSDGTLYAIALSTVLHGSTAPDLVLLDDLDQGLHPVAQADLVRVIRSVLEVRPTLQVVATSHSPFVLDALEGHEAFVVGAVDATSSKIQRLDAHPEWARRSGYFHPGEFWSAVGEEWVGASK